MNVKNINSTSMSNKVDYLIYQILPDLISDELKWIRKEYGDYSISLYLCGSKYYKESKLLNYLEEFSHIMSTHSINPTKG